MADSELDVRGLRKPDKHPTIFAEYAGLAVGESFVLVNNHDPRHLRDEFDADHPGSYGWDYVEKGPQVWRIRITKLTSTPLPRVLADTSAAEPGATGVVWKLEAKERDLDSNVIALPAGGGIDSHAGPDLDVLIHVLSGGGRLTTEAGTVDLFPGALLWLPRRSRRQFSAGPDGLRYLTVHKRRQALLLEPTATSSVRQAV
ncbi:hypothetical protein A5660_04665 [Mycobacterium alsense]|uniref:DUF2249 domain-containing protein n=1 Tax=Mycobacterium alsense TaxID=324058 RepID=UPI0008009C29|nr:DUF2249 domain-containing protein [Mycobacterium alsense]OBI98688.1 hypothetical protein A5660_04665 [Mycobacterium alsense]